MYVNSQLKCIVLDFCTNSLQQPVNSRDVYLVFLESDTVLIVHQPQENEPLINKVLNFYSPFGSISTLCSLNRIRQTCRNHLGIAKSYWHARLNVNKPPCPDVDSLFFIMVNLPPTMKSTRYPMERTKFVFTGRTEVRLGGSEYM